MRTMVSVAVLAMVATSTRAQASWLSEITGVQIDPSKSELRVTAPSPSAIPEMLRNLPYDAPHVLFKPAGAALAEAIRISRDTNGEFAQPVPPEVRDFLAPYFPPDILNKARYRVGSSAFSLPSDIEVLRNGNAITLDDLILFDDAAQAQNLELWARELTHVVQYKNMGVESFANVYNLTGGHALESQAKENAATIRKVILSGNVRPRYQYTPSAFSAPTPHSAYVAAGQQVVLPHFCMRWAQKWDGMVVIENECVVSVVVSGYQTKVSGRSARVPCTDNCEVAPRSSLLFGPAPVPVTGVAFEW